MGLTTTLITSFIVSTNPSPSSDIAMVKPLIQSYIKVDKNRQLTGLEKEYENLIKKVEQFKTLGNDWDGYGALKPNNNQISDMISFLKVLKENTILKPEVFPKTDGGVAMYWKNNNNYLEVSMKKDSYFSFFYDFDDELYGQVDILIGKELPEKLKYAINYIKNKTSSNNNNLLIKSNTINKITEDFLLV